MKNDWLEVVEKGAKEIWLWRANICCPLDTVRKLKNLRAEVLTAVTANITVMQCNMVDTQILEESAAFFFQVKGISSARLYSITSQKTVNHQRKNSNKQHLHMNQSVSFSGRSCCRPITYKSSKLISEIKTLSIFWQRKKKPWCSTWMHKSFNWHLKTTHTNQNEPMKQSTAPHTWKASHKNLWPDKRYYPSICLCLQKTVKTSVTEVNVPKPQTGHLPNTSSSQQCYHMGQPASLKLFNLMHIRWKLKKLQW
jgi:hypothetical protein